MDVTPGEESIPVLVDLIVGAQLNVRCPTVAWRVAVQTAAARFVIADTIVVFVLVFAAPHHAHARNQSQSV
ncbi:hypothetical protein D3C79_918340 [compost metagenome]